MSEQFDKLLQQAFQARREHRLEDAKRDLAAAVAICRESSDKAALAKALAALGQIERDMKCTDAALRLYEEAAAIRRELDDPLKLAHTVRHVGDIHRNAGRAERAEACYNEALALYRNHERTPALDLANAIRGLALLKGDAGNAEQARQLWQEAHHLYRTADVQEGVAESARRLAMLTRS